MPDQRIRGVCPVCDKRHDRPALFCSPECKRYNDNASVRRAGRPPNRPRRRQCVGKARRGTRRCKLLVRGVGRCWVHQMRRETDG